MKILSVSDQKSNFLLSKLTSDEELRSSYDLLISCGDLEDSYVSSLADSTNQLVYYVNGNHHFYDRARKSKNKDRFNYTTEYIPGAINLHNQVIEYKNVLLTGFEGSMLYNNGPGQYSEEQMARTVRRTIRKIKWIQFKNKLFNKKAKEIIVISHAPVYKIGDGEDLCHMGFKSFKLFIEKIKPKIWIHGHIHLEHFSKISTHTLDQTTIVNTFEYKNIKILDNVEVDYKF